MCAAVAVQQLLPEHVYPSEPPTKATPRLSPGMAPFYPFSTEPPLDLKARMKVDLWASLLGVPTPLPFTYEPMGRKRTPKIVERSLPIITANSEAVKEEDLRPCNLRISIQKAQNLVNADMYGASDPYVSFKWRDQTHTTAVIQETLNPKWNETFEVPYDPAVDCETLELALWDEDRVTAHDRLGISVLDIKKSTYKAKAMKLKVTEYGGRGFLFCSIQRIPDDGTAAVGSGPALDTPDTTMPSATHQRSLTPTPSRGEIGKGKSSRSPSPSQGGKSPVLAAKPVPTKAPKKR